MGGGAPQVPTMRPPDAGQEFSSALGAYTAGAPALYQEEAQYQPLYNQMQQGIQGSNIQFYTHALEQMMPTAQAMQDITQGQATQAAANRYAQYAGTTQQAALAASPQLQALQQYGMGQLGTTADPTLQGLYGQAGQMAGGQSQQLQDLAAQAGRSMEPVNAQLQNLYGQAGGLTQQAVGDVRNIAGQAAADPRSALWQATAANVQGNLGQLDPLTQQLSDTAQSQLALGGQLSPDQIAAATQQARAAYSARGMLGASGSIAAEVLGRTAFQQQMLQQREQFASGVSGLVQQEQAQRTAAATGMSQADIQASLANRQLAGQLYQGAGQLGQAGVQLGAGLQGQIAANIQNAQQQQAGLVQAANAAQTQGLQLQTGLQGSILDQISRQQQAGAAALQGVYGAQQGALQGVLGYPATGADLATQMGLNSRAFGTGSPNLFQGSGLLQLTAQNQMAGYNQQAAANQMNAQSQGAARGAMIGAGAAIGGSIITGVALF
jgi:hypothetical protein